MIFAWATSADNLWHSIPDNLWSIIARRVTAFVRELTERTVESFFEARGLDTPEYAFAIHRRETRDANHPGRDNPHTHVILPGTYGSWADGARLPLYMNRNKRENHIELLHEVAQEQIDLLLTREIGPEWEATYDALILQRESQQVTPGLEAAPPDEPTIPPETSHWSGPSLEL